MSTLTNKCPVCGDAMKRVPTDGRSVTFRCTACCVEVAKAPARDNQRRMLPVRERCGTRLPG
ncbi:hypothetical protein DW352_02055 [Pseudolabrys taiwanensis]|uniref:Uncharacterized protein n=1 Tax=Pseudolabrys taiwanensis TaxID=331696 RepID=A0A345ZR57_9HYPH|nr:hypothetical protein DW352_02055 [Pseudolabrys taiwanensis]